MLRKATFGRSRSHLAVPLSIQTALSPPPTLNPYARQPVIDVREVNNKGTSLRARLRPVTIPDCARHFIGYPALPAVVMFKALVVSCANLLERVVRAPGSKYTVW